MHKISLHPVPCRIKNAPKYTLSLKNFAKNVRNPLFQWSLKNFLQHDTLSHNFLVNFNTLSHIFSLKRTPFSIIFTEKGHPA